MDWQAFGDVICTNSYNGWYAVSGRLDDAEKAVEAGSPQAACPRIRASPSCSPSSVPMPSPDVHAQPPVMWSEEYQADIVEMHIRTLEKLPFIIGTHPWAFADFRTLAEYPSGGGHELQGAFTRSASPR